MLNEKDLEYIQSYIETFYRNITPVVFLPLYERVTEMSKMVDKDTTNDKFHLQFTSDELIIMGSLLAFMMDLIDREAVNTLNPQLVSSLQDIVQELKEKRENSDVPLSEETVNEFIQKTMQIFDTNKKLDSENK